MTLEHCPPSAWNRVRHGVEYALSHFAKSVLPEISGLAMSMNYGFDRVRFVAPVRTGSRIRAVFSLAALVPEASHRIQMRLAVTVEIEAEAKPALVADWLTVLFLAPS